MDGWFRRLKQAEYLDVNRRGVLSSCKFLSYRRLHCHACGTHQDVREFRPADQKLHAANRRCLGRQGAVQLCEHVHVSWSDIEDHVARWQKDRAGDWKACFSCFNIECRDPSHDTRCTAEGTPTWPRARLQAHERDENKVLLTLEWKPHSGLDALTCTAAGQAPAAQLRKVFQKYRQGAGGILFPSGRSSPLPEMACYGPSECTCLYYETGDDKVPNTGGLSKCGGFFQEDWRFRFTSLHRIHRYSFGVLAAKVSTKKHWPCGTDGSVCLVTIYKRQIPVFNKTDLDTRINPGHAWLHAMDPDTYARPSAGLDLPFCKDKECMNYYRRPKAFKCILGGGTLIHDRCTCSSEA